jgi:oligoendopeptidase F
MINTVVRQIAFYTFERKVHEARKEGELTSDQLCDLWISVQHESLGDAVRFDDGYRPSGPISAISFIRRSTFTPMPSAIAW